ncbi:MAG: hypothetical protein KDK69_05345, partial [Chlamydiia bacterium]|nr:hypothetical protein [Chlamydiia bacterium]
EDTDEALVLQIGEFLVPGLGKVIAEKQNVGELEVAPPIAEILTDLREKQATFIGSLELQQGFYALLT